VVATDAFHEVSVQLTGKPQGKRQLRKAPDTVLQGYDIVGYLAEIRRTPRDGSAGLGRQQLPESGLCAFDPAGQDRLSSDEGSDKEMWVRQAPTLPRQPADGPIRI
jgi:hypothetical protein